MAKTKTRVIPLALIRELMRPDFAGVLEYGATCIRRCAKLTHGEDAGETWALRGNMRDHARRLSTLARAVRRTNGR